MITLDEFRRVDLRVGEIVAAEAVRGSDRLLRVEVDLGAERRVLVAGLARHYRPESLVGAKAVVVVNIAPAVIRGIESRGMLLGAGCAGSAPALLTVDRAVPNGTPVE